MIEKEMKVTLKNGLHARPAAELVKNLSRFASTVEIIFGAKQYNAKSILGLLYANIREGQSITVVVEGTDEEEVMEWLSSYL